MKKIIIAIINKPDKMGNFIALLKGVLFNKQKFFRHPLMKLNNKGKLNIEKGGKLFAGFLSNQISQAPKTQGILKINKGGELRISGNVRMASSCKIYVAGILKIGSGTYINPNTLIFARTNVEIGENCAISWDCQILDDDFHKIGNNETSAPIKIGNNVLISSKSIILKGVKIGSGTVIAAGSIITKNLPANCLCGGIPAKVIKENITWS